MELKDAELIQITTSDKLILPGVLFDAGKKRAVIYIHGNGSSSTFYSLDFFLGHAREFKKIGVSVLAFNTRGALQMHRVKTTDGKKVLGGTAYELLKDCVKDIDAVVSFLRARGYKEIYLMGFSTGANKIAVYNHRKPRNLIKGYILASGGDDTGIEHQALGGKRFARMLALCRKKIKQGKGKELVPYKLIGKVYSYRSYFDTINPDGDYNTFPYQEYFRNLKLSTKKLFWQFSKIKKPTLVIYGDRDEYGYKDMKKVMRVLEEKCGAPEKFTFALVPGGDHGFHGRQREFMHTVVSWMEGESQ